MRIRVAIAALLVWSACSSQQPVASAPGPVIGVPTDALPTTGTAPIATGPSDAYVEPPDATPESAPLAAGPPLDAPYVEPPDAPYRPPVADARYQPPVADARYQPPVADARYQPPDAAPAPSSSSDPTACNTAEDCEIHCPVAAGCCDPAPCGCREAINRAQERAVDRAYGKTCERKRCPIVDCKWNNAMGAACEHGHCVPIDGPAAAGPPPGP